MRQPYIFFILTRIRSLFVSSFINILSDLDFDLTLFLLLLWFKLIFSEFCLSGALSKKDPDPDSDPDSQSQFIATRFELREWDELDDVDGVGFSNNEAVLLTFTVGLVFVSANLAVVVETAAAKEKKKSHEILLTCIE